MASDYDELKAIAIEADRRGDKVTAMKAMQKMDAIGQAPETPSGPDSATPWADTAATMVTGALAEPVAGLSGLRTLIGTGDPARAAQDVQQKRDALTYRSDAPNSQAALQKVGETLAPVTGFLGRAQKEAGAIGEKIGGPVGGAIGEAVPTALLALVGIRKAPVAPLKAGPVSSVAAREIVDAGKANNIPVLTSDINPPQTWLGKQAQTLGEKIPITGTGPLRAEQQAARSDAVRGLADQYAQFSYPDIVSNLKAQKSKIKNAAGNVLESTGAKLDAVGPIQLPKTIAAELKMNAKLKRTNVVNPSPQAESDLNAVFKALQEPQTFTTLKENRTNYRFLKDKVDTAGRSQLPTDTKRMAEGLYRAMTDDMKDFARANLSPQEYAQWERANAIYHDEATKLTRTRLKNILDTGDITPENVDRLIFSQKPSEVQLLHRSLSESGRANVRAAIISKVVSNISNRASGFGPDQFLTELNKYGPSVDTFFKGADKQQLEGLRRVLDATSRAQKAAANPPTGQTTIPLLAALGIGLTGAKGIALAGTAGGIAQVYERGIVQSALRALGSGPNSGPIFERRLAAATTAIAGSSQSAQEPARTQDQK